jgi:hypothetical protein
MWKAQYLSVTFFYPAQVHLTEEKSGEVAAAPPPEVQYLDISWQKNLLEEARIGITTIHQVKNTANFKKCKNYPPGKKSLVTVICGWVH